VNDHAGAVPGIAPDTAIWLTVREDSGHTIIAVAGEIDASTAPLLGAAIRDQIRARCQRLIVDLTEVSFIAAAALGALVSAYKHARTQADGRFTVVCAEEPALNILRITALIRQLSVYGTLDEALRTVPERPPRSMRFRYRRAAPQHGAGPG
jgi:anti-sigma B factor antagonist